MHRNMLGAYGAWAASLAGTEPGELSLRRRGAPALATWRRRTMAKVRELLAEPGFAWRPRVTVVRRTAWDGLDIEELTWRLPYGPPTQAVFLKPAGARGRLPAVLALHDHGGQKYFGLAKITRTGDAQHPLMRAHQEGCYGGAAWANELAKRGYAVLVHDAFLFGSRRARYADVSPVLVGDRVEPDPADADGIQRYNEWAGEHEHIVAKSLFSAGTTWPGVFLREDRCALDYLCSRPDVDRARVACGGLSGGGLRTVMLGGLDERIRAAFPVGFMTTWRDFLLETCHTHTWMTYVPGLPRLLDFPEILGLRAPRATFVLNDTQDQLFTLSEMRRADRILREVFAKARAAKSYRCAFYPGPHKFDRRMQDDAFAWLDQAMAAAPRAAAKRAAAR